NIRGRVANNGEGVEILACGNTEDLERFVAALKTEPPPLARVDQVNRSPIIGPMAPLIGRGDFTIEESVATTVRTGVAPDAATCDDCRAEVFDPFARRFRYPFTNWTNCGPRLTIIQSIPYDRRHTTMAAFALCANCEREYSDPVDRRFHAQPIACYACGPRAWIERADGKPFAVDELTMLDEVDAAR